MDHSMEAAVPLHGDTPVSTPEDQEATLRAGYEKPRLIVIGKVRDLTKGNASSGNQDANSNFYW